MFNLTELKFGPCQTLEEPYFSTVSDWFWQFVNSKNNKLDPVWNYMFIFIDFVLNSVKNLENRIPVESQNSHEVNYILW